MYSSRSEAGKMAFHQTRTWNVASRHSTVRHSSVIHERAKKQRAFSSEGIRGDIAFNTLLLIILAAACLIVPDIVALHKSVSVTGQLSSEVRVLADTTAQLQARLDFSTGQPVTIVNPSSSNLIPSEEIPTVRITAPEETLPSASSVSGNSQLP